MIQAPAPPPSLDWCLFLDVDGTLIELTDTPLHTRADDALKSLLARVATRLDGALALVSGRSIAYLDALFAPLRLPTAGLHGVERRTAAGALSGANIEDSRLDTARRTLFGVVEAHPGSLLEDKGKTIAVHFRMAPLAESAMCDAVQRVAAGLGDEYHVQGGNMMLEIKPAGYSKGAAIEDYLREPPFTGRTPVFLGDDLTDLDGFRRVESHGGLSVGVGNRVDGRYQLADPPAVRAWLETLASLPG